jgi:hypothetical protein
MPLAKLIQHMDTELHKEYVVEIFKEDNGGAPKKKVAKVVKKKIDASPVKPSVLVGCPSIATLGPDHPARIYIEGRKIPEQFYRQIFWCDDFKALVDKVSPNNEFALRSGDGRIILPCLDRSNNVMAIQGRTLDPNATVRYITVKAYEDAPKTYGINRLGATWQRIYIVEGPFDSLFLPNCLAMAGSDIPSGLPRDKVVIVYDNEPTKTETRTKLAKAIDNGYRVCIWPDTIQEKDINAMVLAGYPPDTIRSTIDRYSYTGLEAKAKLQDWKRPHKKPISQKGHGL